MILYVNGDSHSAGTDLTDPSKAWPQVLADRLGFQLVNESKAGASNDRILRTASDYLSHVDRRNVFAIIGWTSWEREEWQLGRLYYDVNAGGHDTMPAELVEKYKDWVTKQGPDEQSRKSKHTQDQLHRLHRSFKDRYLRHLFFNAVMPFQHNLIDPVKLDWHGNYLGPYENDLSYYWYLKNHGWKHTANNHYTEEAQAVWADVLYNYIQENQLL